MNGFEQKCEWTVLNKTVMDDCKWKFKQMVLNKILNEWF